MCGDNHNRVADLDGILPAGDDDRAVTVDKGNQQPFLQRELCQRGICDLGFRTYTKFDGLHARIKHMVERLDVTVHRVFLGTHVGDDCF